MTKRFAIYYADGSVYDGGGESDELVPLTLMVSRDWLNAPADRVLSVVVEDPYVSRTVLHGTDWYFPVEDGQYGGSDHLRAWLRKLGGAVKAGEYVSSEAMAAMWAWAKRYARIPRDDKCKSQTGVE